jgi:ribonuclease HI
MREGLLAKIRKSVTANTVEETAPTLLNTKHSWRIYSDGGCDGNGAKGIWGKSGYEAVIYACGTDETVTEVANIYGLVVNDVQSEWFMGAVKGTNQTRELCGVMQALLWLLEHAFDGHGVVMCVDSLYAGNQLEG